MKIGKFFIPFFCGCTLTFTACTSDTNRYQLSENGSFIIDTKEGDVFLRSTGELVFEIPEIRELSTKYQNPEIVQEVIVEEVASEELESNPELIDFLKRAINAGRDDEFIIYALKESGFSSEDIPKIKKLLAELHSNDLDYQFRSK
jgi:hypothetical protein